MRIYVMISKVRSTEKSIINHMEEVITWQKEVDSQAVCREIWQI